MRGGAPGEGRVYLWQLMVMKEGTVCGFHHPGGRGSERDQRYGGVTNITEEKTKRLYELNRSDQG